MRNESDLREALRRIDGRGYKAYKSIAGSYELRGQTLFIDHVQGDPFAAPSRLRLRIAQSTARFPKPLFANRTRRIALEGFLAREVRTALSHRGGAPRGSSKSGLISIDAGHQEVLERTTVVVTDEWVEARIEVGLPALGRTVLGRQAESLLLTEAPRLGERALLWESVDEKRAEGFVDTLENHHHLQDLLSERGLVAFVADGAVLPRESGASDRPMHDAVRFRSPERLRVELPLLNAWNDDQTIRGLGIRKGVNLVVGGGYHGKSTLLKAIERGVYPHVPGDGREYVVTSKAAVKIRAEDGRRVEAADISPFIQNLPMGRSTESFRSDDASGSTSQAANIVEAIEAGADLLLLDEDTSATNFMVRDARMQALVAKEQEPIVPFVDRIHELYEELGVSTILVMGGSGDYFDDADTVICMKEFLPDEVTEEAKQIAGSRPTGRRREVERPLSGSRHRTPQPESFDPSRGRKDVKIEAKGLDLILYGRERIDLRGVEQLVDISQTRAIGHAIHLAVERFMGEGSSLSRILDALEELFDREGLDVLAPFGRPGHHPGNYARPRRFEIAAGINRLRTMRMKQM